VVDIWSIYVHCLEMMVSRLSAVGNFVSVAIGALAFVDIFVTFVDCLNQPS
jgi:hypothetical protein